MKEAAVKAERPQAVSRSASEPERTTAAERGSLSASYAGGPAATVMRPEEPAGDNGRPPQEEETAEAITENRDAGSPAAEERPPGARSRRDEAVEEPAAPEAAGGEAPAGQRAVELREPAGARAAPAGAKYRLPTFADLESVFKSATLKVPEQTIKDAVERILIRMKKDGKLQVTDSVATIMGKLFPSPGTIDEAEFKRVIDVSDRTRIYESVLDAEAKVKSGDKAKLKSALADSATLATDSGADTAKLQLVFGSKHAEAKSIYDLTATALTNTSTNIDTKLTIDYNLDANAMGLGGWANFASQRMHLKRDIGTVKDEKQTKVTLIHEGAHLAKSTVKDSVYYPTGNFESQSEDVKIANAAHFEEVPRRKLGTSRFSTGFKFEPGVTTAGSAPTFEDKVRSFGRNYLREAWDRAVDYQLQLGELRREILGGSKTRFNSNKAKIVNASKVLGLTIHKQAAADATVTTLDVVIAEGIASAVSKHGAKAKTHPVAATSGDVAVKGTEFVRAVLDADTELLGPSRWTIVWFLKQMYKNLW